MEQEKKKSEKQGRNADKCKRYRSQMRREKNKLKKSSSVQWYNSSK